MKYFRLLVKHGGIISLNVSGSRLSNVTQNTLMTVLRKMKLLRVENCRFTKAQVNTIFQQISEGESELESLYIGNNRLTGARPELLRGAVPRLRSLQCDDTMLGYSQIIEMLQGILDAEDLRLEEINLMRNNLTSISPVLLSESLNRLKIVNLWGCDAMLQNLMIRMENNMVNGETNIQSLDISKNDLFTYCPRWFDNAIWCIKNDVYVCLQMFDIEIVLGLNSLCHDIGMFYVITLVRENTNKVSLWILKKRENLKLKLLQIQKCCHPEVTKEMMKGYELDEVLSLVDQTETCLIEKLKHFTF